MTCIGRSCGQGSSSFKSSSHGFSFSLLPWLSQSRIMNCSHAAASKLSVVAGWNSWRVRSSRLTVRGFGLKSAQSFSGYVSSRGTLRPKRVTAPPIAGFSRSLKDPSAVRVVRWRLYSGEGLSTEVDEVSYRLRSRSLMRSPTRVRSPRGTGSRCHRNLRSSASVTSVNTRENTDLAIREDPFYTPLYYRELSIR